MKKNNLTKNSALRTLLLSCVLFAGHWCTSAISAELEFGEFKTTQPFTKNPQENISLKVSSDASGIHLELEIEEYEKNPNSHISSRDEDIIDDYVEVIFDFSGDGNTAYGIRVGANGSINDFTIDHEITENRDWDGDWIYQSQLRNSVWTTQIDIPWSTTLFDVGENNMVAAKFYAAVWMQQQRTKNAFPPISSNRGKFLSNFHPISLAYQANSELSFTPYITYDKEFHSRQSDFRQGFTFVWKDQDQALAYAFSPDFGQEKSNELVLNLSAIETFFSEKRRFFLEESELYSVSGAEGLRIFHSPRIGSFSGPNEQSLNIKHALKYSTRFSNWEIGSIFSQEEGSSISSGREFAIGRARYSNSGSNIGYLFTHTDTPSEASDSQVHALDFKHDITDVLDISGFVARSNINTFENNTLSGNAKYVRVSWDISEEWSNQIGFVDYDKNFDVSDAGYVQRVNRKQLEFESTFEISRYQTVEWLESSEHGFEFQYVNNQQNQNLGKQFASENEWTLINKQTINVELEVFSDFTDDNLTRGNNPVRLPLSILSEIEFESNTDNGWLYRMSTKSGKEGLSGRYIGFGSGITYSPAENITIDLGIDKVEYDSYLLWDEENTLVDYAASETELELAISARIQQSHSFDIKLESVALKARAINQYFAQLDGSLQLSSEEADDFSIGELAMELKYHFHPSSAFNLYVIYSRGGEVESEFISQSSRRLIRSAYQQEEISRLFVKTEYRF